MSGLRGHRRRKLPSGASDKAGDDVVHANSVDPAIVASPVEKVRWVKKRRKLHRNMTWWGRPKHDKPDMATVSYIDIDMTSPQFGPKPSAGFTVLEESLGLNTKKWNSFTGVSRDLTTSDGDGIGGDDDDGGGGDDDGGGGDDCLIVPMTELNDTEESREPYSQMLSECGSDPDRDSESVVVQPEDSPDETKGDSCEHVQKPLCLETEDLTSNSEMLLSSSVGKTEIFEDLQPVVRIKITDSTTNSNPSVSHHGANNSLTINSRGSDLPRSIFSLYDIDLDDEVISDNLNTSSSLTVSMASLNTKRVIDSGHRRRTMVSSASCSHLGESYMTSRSYHGLPKLKKSQRKGHGRVSSVQDLTVLANFDPPTITITEIKAKRLDQGRRAVYCVVHDPAFVGQNNNNLDPSGHVPLLDWEQNETSSFIDVLLELSNNIKWECTCLADYKPTADRRKRQPAKSASLRRVASDVFAFRHNPDASVPVSSGWNDGDDVDSNFSNGALPSTDKQLRIGRTVSVSETDS